MFTVTKCITAFAVIGLFTAASFHRNNVWQTYVSLWEDASRKSPNKSRTHNNLGNSYRLAERHFGAIEEYKIAIKLDPNNMEAYYNLAWSLENVGFWNQAVPYYDYFCKHASSAYLEQKAESCDKAERLSRRFTELRL